MEEMGEETDTSFLSISNILLIPTKIGNMSMSSYCSPRSIISRLKRKCRSYSWGRILNSHAFIKKMEILYKHPLISILASPDVRNTIIGFGGESCIAPVLVLTMNLSWRCILPRDRKEYDKMQISWRGSTTFVYDAMIKSSSICLFRWYVEIFLGLYPGEGGISVHSIHPYSSLNSLGDLEWYFDRTGVDWRGVCRGEYEGGTDSYHDAFVLAEHHGFIPLSKVPKSILNIIRPAIRERWDIVDKYMKRGDIEKDNYRHNVVWSLSLDRLEMFLKRYDVWEPFRRINMTELKDQYKLFFRYGIISHTFTDSTRSAYDLWKHIPVPPPEVPTNVVEDLFTLSAKRAQEVKYEMIYHVVDEIIHHYFGELKEDLVTRRCASPSSHHRVYSSPVVNDIISLVRKGDGIAAGELLVTFIENGRTYEGEMGSINRSIAKQLDLIHAGRMSEDSDDSLPGPLS